MNQSFEVIILINCKVVQDQSIYIENDLEVQLRAVTARLKERATIWAHHKTRVLTISMALTTWATNHYIINWHIIWASAWARARWGRSRIKSPIKYTTAGTGITIHCTFSGLMGSKSTAWCCKIVCKKLSSVLTSSKYDHISQMIK